VNQTDTSAPSESRVETARTAAESGREYASKTVPYLRRTAKSDAVLASVGGTALLGGLRAFLRGKRRRGLTQLSFGAALLATALARRRFRTRGEGPDVEERDVVDGGPDVDSVADETGGAGVDHASGDAAAAVTDTSPDVEDVSSGRDSDSDAGSEAAVDQRDVVDTGVDTEDSAEESEREAGESEREAEDDGAGGTDFDDADRLGEAAFDGQSREVPAPQRAFNRGFLAHSAEAFWGIRTRDDAVLVSQDYDAIEGRDGVRFVDSSEIGDDARELPIPKAILDHWNVVSGGDTAVAGGDDVLFVTTDDLATDGVLCVLPAAWADDASE
jgi:hypothetical protein